MPRFPSGFSRLWSGPATKPSSEIDMWQVVSGIGVLLVIAICKRRHRTARERWWQAASTIYVMATRTGALERTLSTPTILPRGAHAIEFRSNCRADCRALALKRETPRKHGAHLVPLPGFEPGFPP